MILPEIMIPVSINIFIENMEYFLDEYAISDKLSLNHEKIEFFTGIFRYIIFCDHNMPNSVPKLKIGEIDVFVLDSDRVKIRAAVVNLEQTREGLDFFDKFYLLINDNWMINPYINKVYMGVEGPIVARETLFRIASTNNIYEVESITCFWVDTKGGAACDGLIDIAISWIDKSSCIGYDSVSGENVRKYQNEISKGLPNITTRDRARDDIKTDRNEDKTDDSSEESLQQTCEPWEQITERGVLQEMVKLLHSGLSPQEIAEKLGYERSTVYKRLSELRGKYGKVIVPYFQKWRN